MTSLAHELQQLLNEENRHNLQYPSVVAYTDGQDLSVAYPVIAPSHTEYHTGMPQNAELANNTK